MSNTTNILTGHFGSGTPAAPEDLSVLMVSDSENDFLVFLAAMRRGAFAPEGRRVSSFAELRTALEARDFHLVVIETRLPEVEPSATQSLVEHYSPGTLIAIVTGPLRSGSAIVSLGCGAGVEWELAALDELAPLLRREMRQAAERAVRRGERPRLKDDSDVQFRLLMEHLPECFWLYDVRQRRVSYVNDAYARITGRPVEALLDDPNDILEAIHDNDRKRLSAALTRARFGGIDDEFRLKGRDGNLRWVHIRTFPVRDRDGVVHSVGGAMADITDVVSQQYELQRMAHFDALTGLPNRLLFKERLSASLAMARRNGWQLALLFVDIDRFKVINDTLGHAVGDELLRLAAKRLRQIIRESDTLCRLGGDEFAIVLPDLQSAEEAAAVARKLIDGLGQPFLLAGEDMYVSGSIGITLFPDDGEDVETLGRNADVAMYRAKDAGRSTYEFYRADMNRRARELLTLEVELRHALARGEFELHYQPKVDLRDGRMVGLEALIRWRRPQQGLVSPGDFIPLLEETGLIVPVGAWVLQDACRQLAIWHGRGHRHLAVAVNLSGRQLSDPTLVATVRETLARTGLPAEALELELTESMLMQDAPAVESLLGEFRRMGLTLSVDDFGTGYSSLAYLKRFPLNTLKVDRSFVRDIDANADDASITRAVIQMAHELSLKVVAEGVETEAQIRLLAEAGCDQIQGYYFARPLPADELSGLLAEGRTLARELRIDSAAAEGDGRLAQVAELQRRLAKREETLRNQAAEIERLRLARPSLTDVGAGLGGWLDSSLAGTEVGVLGVDVEGWVVSANSVCEKVLPGGAALVGRPVAEVLPPTMLDGSAALRTSLSGPVLLSDGWRRVSIMPLVDPTGAARGWLVLLVPHRIADGESKNDEELPL